MTYELFSERAREVAQRANEEALSFVKESRIDTHHILLGVLKEGAGTAVHVLNAHGINVQSVRTEIEPLGEKGPYQDGRGKLPMTATAKNLV
jgi:ATP-dependent Clp protease ATP-binding subunit ClpC